MSLQAPQGVTVVLCRPRHAGNIGATARIMKNLGYSSLTLVQPTSRGHLEAMRMAADAQEILEGCSIVDTLQEAIAASHRAYAVTRRPRSITKRTLTPEEAAAEIGAAGSASVALVFGSEKLGLSTEDVRLCDAALTIPSSSQAPSLNLAQAVALVLYLCARREEAPPAVEASEPSTSRERRILYERMESTLKASGYFRTGGAAQTMADIEDIFNRAQMNRRDVDLLLGMFRRILAAVERKGE